MRRLFVSLLIACSYILQINADTQAKGSPENVKNILNFICTMYSTGNETSTMIENDPISNQVITSTKCANFKCDLSDVELVGFNYTNDEKVAYQFLHLIPGSDEMYDLTIVGYKSTKTKTLPVRTKSNQEMWLMCTKNPTNPMLRDAYAIVWEKIGDDNDNIEGKVIMATSLRPESDQMSSNGFDNTPINDDAMANNRLVRPFLIEDKPEADIEREIKDSMFGSSYRIFTDMLNQITEVLDYYDKEIYDTHCNFDINKQNVMIGVDIREHIHDLHKMAVKEEKLIDKTIKDKLKVMNEQGDTFEGIGPYKEIIKYHTDRIKRLQEIYSVTQRSYNDKDIISRLDYHNKKNKLYMAKMKKAASDLGLTF